MLKTLRNAGVHRATRLGGAMLPVLLSLFCSTASAAPGEIISNQGSVEFTTSSGLSQTFTSNTVDVVTLPSPSTSSLELTRIVGAGAAVYQETVGPSACMQGAGFVPLGNPVLTGGGVLDPTLAHNVGLANSYNLGEPVFVRLTDTDQNFDYLTVEYTTVTVTHPASGDSETIQLTETGPNTGIFAGYIQSATGATVAGDCLLQGTMNSDVVVTYVDPGDGADSASISAVLDPVNVVFESRTGTRIDGAIIELVDALTGAPATVYGNDGVSTFPSIITSGATETDSSGATYDFGPGEYRFPVVPNGNYRVIVTPSTDYTAPSTADINDLQLLPGAPYDLAPGSFGNDFNHSGTVTFQLDLPVDPQSTALFLQKTTLTTIASIGDFVRYELVIENAASSGTATDVEIIDQLPPGVRFVPGSVTRDDNADADPVVDMTAGTLLFDVGDLAVAEQVRIAYVVEIVSGSANDELTNVATAYAGSGLISNESNASIRLTEDLFRSTGTIMGRIVDGDCQSPTFSEDQGVANVRVYLEDGRYAVSDEGGRFHFEGLKPGTHVAQLDPISVPEYYEVVGCATAGQFAGRPDSQFVRLTRGSLKRADFYLRRKEAPEGKIDIEMQNVGTDSTEQVGYILNLNGQGNVRIDNLQVSLLLPEGVSYTPGTMTVGGKPVVDPRISGPAVIISLPEKDNDWTEELRFTADIDPSVDGELTSKAYARFDTGIEAGQQTPLVETRMVREQAVAQNEGYVLNLTFDTLSADLSPADMLELGLLIEDWQGVRDIKIQAVGHSDADKISARNQHLFKDNYVLSAARASAAAAYIAQQLGVPYENIQVEGRGPDDPIASNSTSDGKRANRRVEMILSGVRPKQPSFLEVTQASSGTQVADTKGTIPGLEEEQLERKRREEKQRALDALTVQKEPEITTLDPGIEMLLPQKNHLPAMPVTKVSVKHDPTQSVEVYLNDKPVTALNYDGMVTNVAGTLAISRWAGVDLQDGENVVKAVVRNEDGSIADTMLRTVYYTGAPIRGEIVADMSTLVADGKTRPVVAVRFFDRNGEMTRAGSAGTFTVSSPYRSWWEVEDNRKNKIVEVGNRQPLYRVEDDGIALIELAPTTHSGEAVLTFNYENNRQQEMRVWLSAEPREWILVGFAEGTAGYNTISDNQTAAFNAGMNDGYYDEGRVAFFAKGAVKGEFLLTVAYDSARDRDESRNQFETMIDPNAYYPLYADTSEQRFEAASQRKLFVKLEKKQFYALFGDFNSGLSYTDLARYERRMNGLHSEYRGENVGYTAFASETDQSFIRDEMRGDGTSGLYRLSSAPIIGNSDQVRLEVRDRFDTGQVLSTTKLSRHLDYSIDTLEGTLFFKRPIPSRDQNFNPIFIVAEYESYSDANEGIVAGGRGSLHFKDNTVEVGVTHINDGQEGSEADLTGADVRWQVNDTTEFRAEFAHSNREELTGTESGSAHSAWVKHQGEKVDVQAYIKEVDEGYGLGLQSAAETGIRKVGIDGRAKLSERFSIDAEATWQQNLVTEAIRNTAMGRVRYNNRGFDAMLGLVHAEDTFDDGTTATSDLAEVALSQQIGDMTLRASSNFAISGEAESLDYPTSYIIGADWKVLPTVDVFAEYEDATGRDISAQMTRVGVRASPWHRAEINSSVTNESSEFGPRMFANLGLIQGFKLTENWILDLGVDANTTLVDPAAQPFDPDRELSSGSFNEDFAAYFVGATYSSEYWSANGRVEMRDSDSSERLGLLLGWYREPTLGHSMSAGFALLNNAYQTGEESNTATLKYGWAWHKADSRWTFLNRIDLIYEQNILAATIEENHRLVNNFNANRRMSERSELSLQYAFKYVRATFDDLTLSGYTDLIGIDYRHGFSPRWDAGINTSILHSYNSETIDYGLGFDVGFNLRDNMWITVGYNVLGFHDEDFSEARYTAEGPFIRLSIKADQYTLKRIAGQN